MFVDVASSREAFGVGVFLISSIDQVTSLSYKLEFETTNNTTEFKALVLGLRDASEMGVN